VNQSEVGSPKSEVEERDSRFEIRNSKLETRESASSGRDSNFDFPMSALSAGPPTSDVGLRTLIIGYGNPVRSDDGFGWHASRLLARVLAGENVEVITCHQLTPELAEPLSRANRAVFIDADSRGAPGEIHCVEVPRATGAPQSFTHTCTPSGLLESADLLYGHRPWATAITVSAQTFDFGDTLSAAVAAALPKVVEQVRQLAVLSRVSNFES